jgi:hypothetical protein
MKAGEAIYTAGRWGDYSATVVDPTDDLTIWTIQEYAKSPSNTWSTWWTRLDALMTITGCPGDQTLACTGAGGAPYSFTLTATNPRGTPFVFDFYIDGILVENNFIPGSQPGPAVSTRTFSATYPIGTSVVRVIADEGNTSDLCTFEVTVQDGIAPSLTCPGTRDPASGRLTVRAECTSPAGAAVSFAATVTDNCDPNPTVTYSQNPGTTFPIGTTPVTVTATDASGNVATCGFDVIVEDTTPPFVSATARRLMLFLPRNGLIDCVLQYSAFDTCDASLANTVAVYSNQPDTGGSFTPDAVWNAANQLEIRAEVDLTLPDPGRVFLIVVESTDDAGLVGRNCTWVIVPKTATAQDVVGARNIAVAAEGPCDSAGTIPAGWFTILPTTTVP